VYLSLVTIVVQDYDQAIGFYAGALGFDLVAGNKWDLIGGD
jgi:catechol 2,3-dioxygenase-like lactoylglutathione lyase family enzyme